MSPKAVVSGAGWSGAARGAGGRRELRRRSARAALPLDPENLSRLFPGRWNPRRALPEGIEPLVAAAAMALEEAGWWTPGSMEPVEAGLVLGTDSHFFIAAAGLARELGERGPAGISPGGFLFSLPSSATAVLGILFGLRQYQATVVEGGLSGLRAVGHALDLLRTGRLERAVAAALSVARGGLAARLAPGGNDDGDGAPGGPEIELGVAVCLTSEARGPAGEGGASGRGLPLIEECCILDHFPEGALPAQAEGIHPTHRALAAPALLAVAAALEVPGPWTLAHHEPGRPGVGVIRVA